MMKKVFVVLLFIITAAVNAQTKAEKEALKAKKASDEYTYQGNKALEGDKPVQAEVDYRNAIVKNKENVTAQYNLGSLYYQSYGEAFARLKKASETPNITDNERHQIFHNLGNTFMKTKEYDKAVQAYKEALRYDSTDEQTRYNLAVAKDMLKKNPPKNDNKDNKDNKNNQDNKNDKNKDNQDNKDNKNDKNKDNQDNKDNKNDKNKNKQKNKDNKNDKNKDKDKNKDNQDNKDDKNDKGDKDNDNQKPRPSSLSPQQMERILEAMNSEERKTQEKVNGQKVKGQRSKSEKDW